MFPCLHPYTAAVGHLRYVSVITAFGQISHVRSFYCEGDLSSGEILLFTSLGVSVLVGASAASESEPGWLFSDFRLV